MLGLVAVGTWTTYSDIATKMDREAEVVNSLYRDISFYPKPVRDALQSDLKDYTRYVANIGWQLQQRE